MTKAVIYARYSSELQSERSIDDQVALCREFAARERLEVVTVYHDKALSGASMMGRHGLLDMMEAAKAGEFSVLVVEALDRVSRDQEDLAGIFKRLTFSGVQIRAVHDGIATDMLVGLRGLVGTLYLKDLAQKVHRGMAGVTRDGRHAGGRSYGYRAVAGARGELVIEPAEAQIVRRIFSEYTSGHNPRAIAASLNHDGIPPPRGQVWSGSTLNGNASRHHGILLNPIYAGTIVWNRVRMIKDPIQGGGSLVATPLLNGCGWRHRIWPSWKQMSFNEHKSASKREPTLTQACAAPLGTCSPGSSSAAAAVVGCPSRTRIMGGSVLSARGRRRAGAAPIGVPSTWTKSSTA